MVLAVVVVLSAFSGGAAAQTTNGEVGICVIGVDSPCNGEEWDGDPPNGDVPGDFPGGDVPGDFPGGDVPGDFPGSDI